MRHTSESCEPLALRARSSRIASPPELVGPSSAMMSQSVVARVLQTATCRVWLTAAQTSSERRAQIYDAGETQRRVMLSAHVLMIALALWLHGWQAPQASAQCFTAVELPLPTGAVASRANRMSNDGRWIAGSVTYSDGRTGPVAWHDGAVVEIGAMDATTGSARDVNNSGLVVGQLGSQAFAFQGGKITILVTIPNAPSIALAVNDSGTIAGQAGGYGSYSDQNRAVIWGDTTQGPFDVHGAGDFPNWFFVWSSSCNDIAADNTVVGTHVSTHLTLFTYSPEFDSLFFGFLTSGQGWIDNGFRALNPDMGTGIRFGVSDSSSLGERFIYRWSQQERDTRRVDRSGALRFTSMTPIGVNAWGEYVGTADGWARYGRFSRSEVSLQSTIQSQGYAELREAVDISNEGEVLANGVNAQGNWRAYRVLRTAPDLAAFTTPELEPCGAATNDGCWTGSGTEPISIGERVRGTLYLAVNPTTGDASYDLDVYEFTLTETTEVSVRVSCASPLSLRIGRGGVAVSPCSAIRYLGVEESGCPQAVNACLSPGAYFLTIAPAFDQISECDVSSLLEYGLELAGTPTTCTALIVDEACRSDVTDVYESSDAVAGAALVACAVSTGLPECGSQGGTVANSYARSIPSSAVDGSVGCVDFGVWSVRKATSSAGDACGNYQSDLPLPATLGLYEDLDGGSPRNKILTANDGNDLRLIAEYPILIPGGAYVASLHLETPVCLAGLAGDVVVVLDCPDLFSVGATPAIPDRIGYQIRAGGGRVAGQGSNTYVRLGCNDSPQQYVLADSISPSYDHQWIVTLRGDFSGCGGGCLGDLDGSGEVDGADLTSLLVSWGGSESPGDLNGDGVVNGADLATLLIHWGVCLR